MSNQFLGRVFILGAHDPVCVCMCVGETRVDNQDILARASTTTRLHGATGRSSNGQREELLQNKL